jgi:hypothetical protein
MGLISADAMQKLPADTPLMTAQTASQPLGPSWAERAESVQNLPVGDPRRTELAMGMLGPSTIKPKLPYSGVSDQLMGFRKTGQNIPYEESKYSYGQPVKVQFEEGEPFYDAVKGLNKAHAMERARRNWPGATIKPATWADLQD